MSGISALMKGMPESSLSLLPHEGTARGQLFADQGAAFTRQEWGTLILDFPASRAMRTDSASKPSAPRYLAISAPPNAKIKLSYQEREVFFYQEYKLHFLLTMILGFPNPHFSLFSLWQGSYFTLLHVHPPCLSFHSTHTGPLHVFFLLWL